MLYGIPLDRKVKFDVRTIVNFGAREMQSDTFTEHSYVEKLKMADAVRIPDEPSQIAALILGRGSGKDHLLALICAYENHVTMPVSWGDASHEAEIHHYCATRDMAEHAAEKLATFHSVLSDRTPVRFVTSADEGKDYRLLLLNELDRSEKPKHILDSKMISLSPQGRSLVVTTPNPRSRFIDRSFRKSGCYSHALFINIPTWELVDRAQVPDERLIEQFRTDEFKFEYGAYYKKVRECDCRREAKFAIVSVEQQEHTAKLPFPPNKFDDPYGDYACRDCAGRYLSEGVKIVEL